MQSILIGREYLGSLALPIEEGVCGISSPDFQALSAEVSGFGRVDIELVSADLKGLRAQRAIFEIGTLSVSSTSFSAFEFGAEPFGVASIAVVSIDFAGTKSGVVSFDAAACSLQSPGFVVGAAEVANFDLSTVAMSSFDFAVVNDTVSDFDTFDVSLVSLGFSSAAAGIEVFGVSGVALASPDFADVSARREVFDVSGVSMSAPDFSSVKISLPNLRAAMEVADYYALTGDSTRGASNNNMTDQYRYMLGKAGIELIDNADSGDRIATWADNTGDVTANDLVASIPGDGSGVVWEFSLGINDVDAGATQSPDDLMALAQPGIDAVLAAKPNVTLFFVQPVPVANQARNDVLNDFYDRLLNAYGGHLVRSYQMMRDVYDGIGTQVFYLDGTHPRQSSGSVRLINYIFSDILADSQLAQVTLDDRFNFTGVPTEQVAFELGSADIVLDEYWNSGGNAVSGTNWARWPMVAFENGQRIRINRDGSGGDRDDIRLFRDPTSTTSGGTVLGVLGTPDNINGTEYDYMVIGTQTHTGATISGSASPYTVTGNEFLRVFNLIPVQESGDLTQTQINAGNVLRLAEAVLPVLTIDSFGPQQSDGEVPATYTISADTLVEAVLFLSTDPDPLAADFNTGAKSGYIDIGSQTLTTAGSNLALAIPDGLLSTYKVALLPNGGGDADVVVSTATSIDTTDSVISPSSFAAGAIGGEVDWSFTPDEAGTYRVSIFADGATPSNADIADGTGAVDTVTGAGVASTQEAASLTGVAATVYDGYIYYEDNFSNDVIVGPVSVTSATDEFNLAVQAPNFPTPIGRWNPYNVTLASGTQDVDEMQNVGSGGSQYDATPFNSEKVTVEDSAAFNNKKVFNSYGLGSTEGYDFGGNSITVIKAIVAVFDYDDGATSFTGVNALVTSTGSNDPEIYANGGGSYPDGLSPSLAPVVHKNGVQLAAAGDPILPITDNAIFVVHPSDTGSNTIIRLFGDAGATGRQWNESRVAEIMVLDVVPTAAEITELTDALAAHFGTPVSSAVWSDDFSGRPTATDLDTEADLTNASAAFAAIRDLQVVDDGGDNVVYCDDTSFKGQVLVKTDTSLGSVDHYAEGSGRFKTGANANTRLALYVGADVSAGSGYLALFRGDGTVELFENGDSGTSLATGTFTVTLDAYQTLRVERDETNSTLTAFVGGTQVAQATGVTTNTGGLYAGFGQYEGVALGQSDLTSVEAGTI